MEITKLKDLDYANKKVLLRVDFNVPIKNNIIQDLTKIKKAIPTIKYILEKNGSVIILSHLGRPDGKAKKELSTSLLKDELSRLVGQDIKVSDDVISPLTDDLVKNLLPKEILLLENVRFYKEEKNPPQNDFFAKKLASYADIYVNDAFGVSHRKHSSVYNITKYFNKKAMGLLLEEEIKNLSILKNPKRPFFAIMGGSKLSTKLDLITNLLDKVDSLFIGGGMIYTFLKAKNQEIGDSIFEKDQLKNIKKILEKAKKKNIPIYLPEDLIIADSLQNDANIKNISSLEDIPPSWMGVDIGPITVNLWQEAFKNAKTIFWNGPLGVIEIENFSKATDEITKSIAKLSCIKIVGGGDSILSINKLKLQNKFTHLSTGGGASLEFIEKGTLPGIEALKK